MPAADFFDFLNTSLDLLERDVPAGHSALGAALAGLRARLATGDEARILGFDDKKFRLDPDDLSFDIDVRFADHAVLELIDGEVSLEQAIDEERLWMRGTVEAIEQFYEALLVFLDGTLRSTAFPALLAQYRQSLTASEALGRTT